jgi:hypothetical protein
MKKRRVFAKSGIIAAAEANLSFLGPATYSSPPGRGKNNLAVEERTKKAKRKKKKKKRGQVSLNGFLFTSSADCHSASHLHQHVR